jgi:hypothetical protein
MLKYNEINPLNVFGLRRVAYCPPHFESFVFDLRTQEKAITDWVYENLAGRFYFDDHYYTTESGSVAMSKMIAFEDHGELSYFGLFLDTINTSNYMFS